MSPAVSADGCEFYDNSDRPAFVYYRRADNGSKIEVKPRSALNGLCYYPEASCEDLNFSCCQLTDDMEHWAKHGTNVNLYSCLVCLLLPMLCWRIIQRVRNSRQEGKRAVEDDDSDGTNEEENEADESYEAGTLAVCDDSDDDEEEPSRCRKTVGILTCVGFCLAISFENSMLAGDAFLVPLREIFQFLEDVVTVRVMAAIGSGNVGAVRSVLMLGVFGGAFFGIVAAGCATALCSWPAALRWLLAPYAMHDSALGCPLVPKGDEAAEMAKQYLLFSVWCWPALFVSMALKGFLLGLQEYGLFIFMGLVQTVTQITLLYILFVPHPSLDALGWIVFVGSYMSLISTLGIFLFKRDLRLRYNLTINCAQATELGAPEVVQISWKKASQEGFYAMLLDVAAQVSVTTGVYVAGGLLGVGAMYQVSAWQAAFPQYGLQWIFGVTYVLRLQGSNLVAAKEYKQFRNLFRTIMVYGIILAIVAASSLIPFRVPIAFQEAAQACEYASSLNCANIFASVFGGGDTGGDTLQGSAMLLFVPTLLARSFYQLYKAGLYACLDWSFMASTAVAATVLVFFPTISIAIYLKTVSSILIAMYLPMLMMAIAFLLRTRRNIKRMLSGQRGPWEKEL